MTFNADSGGHSVACWECGTVYPYDIALVMFHRDLWERIRSRGRAVCIPCKQIDRDQRKSLRPALKKAADTVKHHAKRFGMTTSDFTRRYGWEVARVAHDIEHAYENTCSYCWRPYVEMAHGLADVTIDIIDPGQPPYYANTRPCCRTCNTEKGRLTPVEWARKLAGWRLWREQQERIAAGLTPTQLGLDFSDPGSVGCGISRRVLVMALPPNEQVGDA
jgi:hypothetical protein